MEFVNDPDGILCCVDQSYFWVAIIDNLPDFGYAPRFTNDPERYVNANDLRAIADKLDELNSK